MLHACSNRFNLEIMFLHQELYIANGSMQHNLVVGTKKKGERRRIRQYFAFCSIGKLSKQNITSRSTQKRARDFQEAKINNNL